MKVSTVDVADRKDQLQICVERSIKNNKDNQNARLPPYQLAINPVSIRYMRIMSPERVENLEVMHKTTNSKGP